MPPQIDGFPHRLALLPVGVGVDDLGEAGCRQSGVFLIEPDCAHEALSDPAFDVYLRAKVPVLLYGRRARPHTLLIWQLGTDKPMIASGSVIVADRQPVLSQAALVWCMSIIDLGKAVVLCGRTAEVVESGKRLVEPLIGGAGSA